MTKTERLVLAPDDLLAALRQGDRPRAPRRRGRAPRARPRGGRSPARARSRPELDRAEVARQVVELLAADLPPDRPVTLELDRSPRAPAAMGRGKQGVLRQEDVTCWLRIEGRLLDGTRLALAVTERARTKVRPGRIKVKKGHRRQKPTKRKRKVATRVVLRLRPKAGRYPDLDPDAVSWGVKLPGFAEPLDVVASPAELRLKSAAKGPRTTEELVQWLALSLLSLYQALNGARRRAKRGEAPPGAGLGEAAAPRVSLAAPAAAPSPAPAPTAGSREPGATSPDAPSRRRRARLFQNLVLAALADGRIDAAEKAFLADRARRLGLSPGEAQALAGQVTSGEVRGWYRPSDPARRVEVFREVARALHVDGAVTGRERRLIVALARHLEVGEELLAAALPPEDEDVEVDELD